MRTSFGRAWNVEDTAEGHDYPVDVALGDGPSISKWVWLTGYGSDGEFQRIGTVAFTLSDVDGDIVNEHVFIDPDDEDEDDYAVKLQVAPGPGAAVFVTGYTESASALPAFLTLHLEGSPLDTEAFHRYYGHDLLNQTAGCWLDEATDCLIVTGWSTASGTGQNWVTIRHNP